jgi:tRNA nucleotidyltransferase (CCA-adding enzyme)
MMQTYLVGGAVRDNLLQRPIKDRDYVVVGGSASELSALGYIPVGKDFPVFLHPKTRDEYALARVERKIAKGYGGFSFCTDKTVTLEEDLSRRDLTINAMAMDEQGNIIDPYHGQDDLALRVFRHVSDAFIEDPLRVIRIARFMARYKEYGFTIAPETLALMQRIGQSTELAALAAPRVWQETARALLETSPTEYFVVLAQANALTPWFTDLTRSIEQIDSLAPAFVYLQTLAQKTQLDEAEQLAIASALITLDSSPESTAKWCKLLPLPNQVQDCIALAHAHIETLLNIGQLDAQQIHNLLLQCDVQRRPQRLRLTMQVIHCYAQARVPDHTLETSFVWLQKAINAMIDVNVKDIIAQGFSGAQIKTQLQAAQLAQINALLHAKSG